MTSTDADRRAALEKERGELLRRIAEWTVRGDRAVASGSGDLVVPMFAGCGVGVPLFGALAIYLTKTADGAPRASSAEALLGGVLILAIVAFVVYAYRRRAQGARLAEHQRANAMAIAMLRVRVREIDETLRKLGQS
jgi:hypothetical protein